MVEITETEIKRALGMEIPLAEVKEMLERLEFTCELKKDRLLVTAPPIRMDIGEGLVGVADVMEEIARIYGYHRIPETRMADPLPPQRGNPSLEREEHVRDIMVSLGLNEVITHRMTAHRDREPPAARRAGQDLLSLWSMCVWSTRSRRNKPSCAAACWRRC